MKFIFHKVMKSCYSPHIFASLETLKENANDFYAAGEVPILEEVPTPLQFYREFVAPNRPVIIRNALNDWPALKLWTNEYLREKIGLQSITTSVTPNGYADAVNGDYFVLPCEEMCTFDAFVSKLEDYPSGEIYYIQKQNSNLQDEFPDLCSDVQTEIPWASEAVGKKPDAVNFWMGDERAVTSMHKDPYENLYAVIRGQKKFILHPPTDLPWIPYGEYPCATYCRNSNGKFKINSKSDGMKIPWISLDPLKPNLEKFPNYKNSTSINCTINAGELLYLPSFWFHHVRQSHQCIAVNYWYDMEFDIKYCYFKFLEKLIS